ncbi:D-arabinono-1,4-lactone oxidase [Halovivax limisalsi]|uniref:D-arabinono-1,4-lactone oxidase n=1 Tax=Halovivax limisalsi TaxID=1453760 RepID=UPI001FFD0F03|nr:D-arabinono-1,4-lactone oxidase [Halovivax limisalsi]
MTGPDRESGEAARGSSEHPGRWRNWSGSVSCRPERYHRPRTVAEIRALVERHAGERTIRVAGSGHSFSAVVPTDDVLVSLERFTGVRSVEHDRRRATVRAGTTLAELSETLSVHGLAMTNLGDVDRQTIAGALATGTHGTGIELGILSTQIAEIELVTVDGEIRTLSADDGDAFRAAQLSLGALGIVTAVTLEVEPAYRLRERAWTAPLEAVLGGIETIRDRHRHVELFWFPHTDVALVKILEKTDEPPAESPIPDGVAEGATNLAWEAVCRLSSRFPRLSPHLARLTGGALSGGETVGPSHEVFANRREVRFNETEYAVPAADGPAVLRRLRDRVLPSHPEIVFPVEFRYVAGDDIPLSPAAGRDVAYVAVHAYHRKPFRPYFEACESVFDAFDGRPHWGKWYSLDRTRLRERYPEWDAFESVRRRFDPEGTFLNDELSALFDPA